MKEYNAVTELFIQSFRSYLIPFFHTSPLSIWPSPRNGDSTLFGELFIMDKKVTNRAKFEQSEQLEDSLHLENQFLRTHKASFTVTLSSSCKYFLFALISFFLLYFLISQKKFHVNTHRSSHQRCSI